MLSVRLHEDIEEQKITVVRLISLLAANIIRFCNVVGRLDLTHPKVMRVQCPYKI